MTDTPDAGSRRRDDGRRPDAAGGGGDTIGARRAWTPPALEPLPRLTELTLQTGSSIPGDGSTGGGGSTVF